MKSKKPTRRIKQSLDGYTFPDISNIKDQISLVKALNYANYVYELKELKEFAKQFMNDNLTSIPEYEFRSIGATCWLHNNGYQFPPEKLTDLKETIINLSKIYKKEKTIDNEALPANSNKESQTIQLLNEFEKYMDLVMLEKSVPLLQDIIQRFPSADKAIVKNWYEKQIIELSDKDLVKSYPSKEYIKNCLNGLNTIKTAMETAASFVKKTKSIRRTTKQKSPTMLVKKLKYLKEFAELNLKSIPPEKIIGSTSLWVYNTKTRKLSNFVSEVGLTVKGLTIYNYLPEKSLMKTLRNPENHLTILMNCSKVEQRKFMETIKTTGYPLNGRLSPDTIILKAY